MTKPKRLSALSRLVLVKAKVERAKQNLIDMETRLDRHYGYRVGANKHRKTAFRGMPDSYDIPMEALTAAGDVVGNLWGALDHLCYQLIDAFSPTIGEDIGKFNAAGGNAMLPTLRYLIDLVDGILDPFVPFLDSK